MTDLRYPIGPYTPPNPITPEHIQGWIDDLEAFPAQLRAAVEGLTDEQLDTPYRPDGWTLRQVVHHIADSHLNSLIRFKWALTEQEPTIKAYHQDRWAVLDDYRLSITVSLHMIEAVHVRLVALLRSLKAPDFERVFHHPEMKKPVSLARNLGLYAWHGKHHLSHISATLNRNEWIKR